MIQLVIEIPDPPFSIGDTVIVMDTSSSEYALIGHVSEMVYGGLKYSTLDGVFMSKTWSSVFVKVDEGYPRPQYFVFKPSQLSLL